MKKLDELHHGCMAKTADNEPVFVLRAQDCTAPDIVRLWAETFKNLNSVKGKGNRIWRSAKSKEKYSEALTLANMMEEWPHRKIPD